MKSKLEIDKDGNRIWFNENRKYHRLNGPAIEYSNGNKYWFINNQHHRTNGPAVEYADGNKEWWIDNKKYTEEDYNAKIRNR